MVTSHIASLPQTTGITSHPPSDAIDQQQKLTSPVNNTYGNMAIEKGFATSEVGGDEDRTKTTEMLHLKKHFFYATLMASCIAAFAVGRIARICILDVAQRNLLTIYNNQVTEMHRMEKFISLQHNSAVTAMMTLPDPVMKQGKVIPRTTYTSKNFDTRSATTHSRWIVSDTRQEKCSVFRDSPECTPTPATITAEDPILEEHLPSGQHLLLDLENIDSHFLNSESRLASAMLDLVDQCGLTLLSYHCHHLQPSGVSCAGVLLESHVSFHTWPSRGVITIDLFTCGSKSLLPIVPIVEKLFAVPSSKVSNNEPLPKMVWAHKYRGFGDHADRAEVTDMFHFPVGQMSDFKQEVVSATTKYQRMDVYDVLRPGVQSLELYRNSLLNDGSYEAQHPDLFAPDRIVFLDGVLQSRRSGDAAYHESLVHPAMFAHKNPKRVAIVGGGEGATLREVLKHNTVEKVVMIDIDEQMVKLSREFLPFWSDCSTIINGRKSCFEDPRVETYYEDAFQWFIDRFSTSQPVNGKYGKEKPFDVIIMDALDPQVQKEFADTLYNGGATIFSQGLDPNGILIAQVGEANTIRSPSGEFSIDKNRLYFIEMLVSLGFKAVRDYEESHNGFTSPWEFVVAFKEANGSSEWFKSSAEIDLKIRKRGMMAEGSASPFLYFDGATMTSYRYPSKGSEVSFCRSHPTTHDCVQGHGFDPERADLPFSTLGVKNTNNVSEGVVAKADIPQHNYIGLEKVVPKVFLPSKSVQLILRMTNIFPSFWGELLENFAQQIGTSNSTPSHRDVGAMLDCTFLCFVNCDKSAVSNVGCDSHLTDKSGNGSMPISVEWSDSVQSLDDIYNPAKARQVQGYARTMPLRKINEGEELLDACRD